MDPFIGEIRIFPWNYAPVGWADCDGQFLPQSIYQPLFAIIGYTYGKRGNDFALPNLSGRAPLGAVEENTQPNLHRVPVGTSSGAAAVKLGELTTPGHRHRLATHNADRTKLTSTPSPSAYVGRYLLDSPPSIVESFLPGTQPQDATLSSGSIAAAGGDQPHENRQPYLALRFCIALEGLWPERP
ncbi:phage tail protein [Ancylobacter dichloromethanicus]|uniref:Tail protein n=1 Tax=Ancylobacter dichloromethanicus TaxID=518825 RepID=A0A9W6J5S3_9HYPH|nr:tail fiber protein [Ancylobacter dichloromethanicus]MBS7554248.1 phage tail protein [Ancylobacter dichloromethanicus]GLK71370.1 tail protein [Ancylobacter dichloromethanicus]